jgi:hypothetical protein
VFGGFGERRQTRMLTALMTVSSATGASKSDSPAKRQRNGILWRDGSINSSVLATLDSDDRR